MLLTNQQKCIMEILGKVGCIRRNQLLALLYLQFLLNLVDAPFGSWHRGEGTADFPPFLIQFSVPYNSRSLWS